MMNLTDKIMYVYIEMVDGIINQILVSKDIKALIKEWEECTGLSWDKYQELDTEEQISVMSGHFEGTKIHEAKIVP